MKLLITDTSGEQLTIATSGDKDERKANNLTPAADGPKQTEQKLQEPTPAANDDKKNEHPEQSTPTDTGDKKNELRRRKTLRIPGAKWFWLPWLSWRSRPAPTSFGESSLPSQNCRIVL
jgi:hypothetical protein